MTRHRAVAHAFAADLGAPGPAAMARRSLMVPSDLPGVQCRQIAEPGPMQGLRLDQRQADAAAELARLWRDALPGRVRPGGYGCRSHGGPPLSPDEEYAAGEAARLYQSALDAVQWQAGVRGVYALEAAVIRREPAHLGHLAAALIALADHLDAG